ncbi:MAG: hypothetical protein SFX72_10565 [Isosphaeraceae bacterium]|nr:hypothetical protein [Isosphaeraceae bacterium]
MTFEQCDAALNAIRKLQKTEHPRVRVDLGRDAFSGRVAHTDSDPDRRRTIHGPYGVIVLEGLGLSRFPQTYLQIADIPENGITPVDE